MDQSPSKKPRKDATSPKRRYKAWLSDSTLAPPKSTLQRLKNSTLAQVLSISLSINWLHTGLLTFQRATLQLKLLKFSDFFLTSLLFCDFSFVCETMTTDEVLLVSVEFCLPVFQNLICYTVYSLRRLISQHHPPPKRVW